MTSLSHLQSFIQIILQSGRYMSWLVRFLAQNRMTSQLGLHPLPFMLVHPTKNSGVFRRCQTVRNPMRPIFSQSLLLRFRFQPRPGHRQFHVHIMSIWSGAIRFPDQIQWLFHTRVTLGHDRKHIAEIDDVIDLIGRVYGVALFASSKRHSQEFLGWRVP